jgi:hypothetical protein
MVPELNPTIPPSHPPIMLKLIAESPIVSTDTLRPDHLCAALIREADRLGIALERNLWQPAVAIVAHGQYGGICLDLPPKLDELSGEIVSELFDAINWATPSGCYLGASEGDGACFLWTLTLDAQCEAINTDPSGKFEAKTLDVPKHWLSAIVNNDETSFDYYNDKRDYIRYEAFCDGELSDGWHVSSYDDEGDFMTYHDAQPYGVLACDAVKCLAMRMKP